MHCEQLDINFEKRLHKTPSVLDMLCNVDCGNGLILIFVKIQGKNLNFQNRITTEGNVILIVGFRLV